MPSRSLFVDPNDITAQTLVTGDISDDKLIPYIAEAQEIELFNILGENLFNRIDDLVADGEITQTANQDYKYLLDEHIRPMVVQYATARFLVRARYTISEKGAFIHTSTDGQVASQEDLNMISSEIRERAESFGSELYDELCDPSDRTDGTGRRSYPEYNTTSRNQRPPQHEPYDYHFLSF